MRSPGTAIGWIGSTPSSRWHATGRSLCPCHRMRRNSTLRGRVSPYESTRTGSHSMTSEVFRLLDDEVRVREDAVLSADMDLMANIYEGVLPSEYDQFFPKGSPKQIVNLIRLAWDDLATQVGRLPELRGEPLNNSDTEEQRVALLERIGSAYIRNAEPK